MNTALRNFEYLLDKRQNDHEEEFDMTDEEYAEYMKSPCRKCNGKNCDKCEV
jgi:hypothetical protein